MRHVVGDLHEVVELHAVLDHGVVDRAAVDRGVRADLHVVADHDAADLRDLDPVPAFAARSRSRRRRSRRRRARCTRAPIRTPSSSVDARDESRARADRTFAPSTQPGPTTAASPIAQPCADHRVRADLRGRRDSRRRRDHGARVDAGRRRHGAGAAAPRSARKPHTGGRGRDTPSDSLPGPSRRERPRPRACS